MLTKNQKQIIDNNIILLTIEDVVQLTGWCEKTVRNMFTNDSEFPAIKKGKEYQVEYTALKDFFAKRRTNK